MKSATGGFSKPCCAPIEGLSKGEPMKKSVKLSSATLSLAALLAGLSQAMAQVAPTMQEKMACRSDAESLCSQYVGKQPKMQACLRDNRRKVVEAHGG
jgi:hypothetical protein